MRGLSPDKRIDTGTDIALLGNAGLPLLNYSRQGRRQVNEWLDGQNIAYRPE
jgi:hypothetical protein